MPTAKGKYVFLGRRAMLKAVPRSRTENGDGKETTGLNSWPLFSAGLGAFDQLARVIAISTPSFDFLHTALEK
jgi:hypothetical protein